MSMKFKAFITVAAMAVIVSLISVGVFAALQPKGSVGGLISFSAADGVYVQMNLVKDGDTASTVSAKNYEKADKSDISKSTFSMAIGEIALSESKASAELKLTVTNDSTFAITALYNAPSAIDNVTFVCDKTAATSIAAGKTATFTITVTANVDAITEAINAANFNFGFAFQKAA